MEKKYSNTWKTFGNVAVKHIDYWNKAELFLGIYEDIHVFGQFFKVTERQKQWQISLFSYFIFHINYVPTGLSLSITLLHNKMST